MQSLPRGLLCQLLPHRLSGGRFVFSKRLLKHQWQSQRRCKSTYRLIKDGGRDVDKLVVPANTLWLVRSERGLSAYSRPSEQDVTAALPIDPLLLRDQCQCHECVDPHSGQRNFSFVRIPPDLSAERIESTHEEPNIATIRWRDGSDDRHTTRVDVESLYSSTSSREPLGSHPELGHTVPWQNHHMHAMKDSGSIVADYEQFLHDEGTFTRILRALRDYGLAFFEGVPRAEQSAELLGERIGPLRHTFYGRTWDVKDKPKADNVAYTTGDLELHMDLLYMKQPPGLQLLHCIQSSGQGGLSTFRDSFEAASQLYKRASTRSAFDALSSYPVSYHYNASGRAFFDTKPTIELAAEAGNDRTFASSKSVRTPSIRNINWSPPFQAPFSADTNLPGSLDRLRQYLSAAKAFSTLIAAKSDTFQCKLQEGDCVIFNNRRVLHGRTSFTSGSKERWLKGAYVDTDDFESQLRHRGLLGVA